MLSKVLAASSTDNSEQRVYIKPAVLSWTSASQSLGITILGVNNGIVTYCTGVLHLRLRTKIGAFWYNMPADIESKAFILAIDKVKGTSILES